MPVPRYELIDNNIAVLRSRGRPKHDDDVDHSEDEKKYHGGKNGKRNAPVMGKILPVMLVLLLVCVYLTLSTKKTTGQQSTPTQISDVRHDNGNLSQPEAKESSNGKGEASPPGIEQKKATNTDPEPKTVVAVSAPTKDYSHCTNDPPKPKENVFVDKKVEPLWLPAYPTSLPPASYAAFLEALTGVPKAAKSYYRSSPSLKRCHHVNSDFKVDAVTCEIVHPIVPCKRPSPSAQKDNFGSKVLLALRNPLTAFPAYHQSKAEAYHNQKGQVMKEDWIKFRDDYVGDGNESPLFDEWKNFIMEWRQYWSHEAKGPALAGRLSRIFQEEGFPMLFDDGILCLWYKHFYEVLSAEENKRAEEGWFLPEYTDKQLEMMVRELEAFQKEIIEKQDFHGEKFDGRPGDAHLIGILRDYASSVKHRLHEGK
ncbi:hypothetical protein ACHAWF_003408 [Thalassiosira exigua]